MKHKFILALFGYCLILFALTVYSYSQIDLNLTLSSNSLYQFFQNSLIQLGYFNRPMSAFIFLILLLLLFVFYCGCLFWEKKISFSRLKLIVFFSVVILFLSYPAFSHDIFNYMFDARILTKYHANPYLHTALDYQGDLWTRFMHWTHRTYPYGPLWLVITAPFSLLGMGKFVLTLINYKLMFLLFHLGNIFLIHKILSKVNPKKEISGIIFYALNPLILVESVVSPHNESVMLFFLLLSVFYTLAKSNIVISICSMIASAGVKFVSIILVPFLIGNGNVFKKISNRLKLISLFLILLPTLLVEIYSREPYPWYLVLFIGVGALTTQNRLITAVLIGLSIGTELRYLPFLYWGEYTKVTAYWQNLLMIIPVGLSLLYWIAFKLIYRLDKKRSK